MIFNKKVRIKNGIDLLLRNADFNDGDTVLELFNVTHTQTDFLFSYPDENQFDVEKESKFLDEKAKSPTSVEIIAFLDDKAVGFAGIDAVGTKYKIKHRAEFGISVLKEYWGLGIGKALTEACIQCAKEAGYEQIELSVVSNNIRAVSLYQKYGFVEFGRNPKGFRSKTNGFQEIIHMRLEI